MSDIYQRLFIADANGRPIENGKVYVGVENEDPETDPITVYWDRALTQPATQPLAISGGYIWNAGARADVYTGATAYSIRIRDRLDTQVDYIASMTSIFSAGGAGMIGYGSNATYADATVGNELVPRVTLANLPAVSAKAFKLAFLHDSGREGTFICRTGSIPVTDTLQGIYVASNTANFYWERIWDKVHARPEWFGAVANSSGSDCLAAINACITLCPVTQLGPNDYWCSSTISLTTAGRTLQGCNPFYDGVTAGRASRILIQSGSVDCVLMGSNTFTTLDAMPLGLKLKDLYIVRSVAPVIASAAAGVLLKYAQSATIENVKVVDSIKGFRVFGCVGCYITLTNSNRVTAGTGAGTDTWDGYWIDGSASIGLAGGNASIYLTRTQAGCNLAALQAVNSKGYNLTSGLQDTFLDWCESVTCGTGVSVNGGGADANVHISHNVHDQVGQYGIYSTQSATGALDIDHTYIAPSSTAQFGIYLNACAGVTTITGGQILCGNNAGVTGINLNNCEGVTVLGTMITECATTTVGITGTSANIVLEPVLHNESATGGAAVQLNATAVTGCRIAPTVKGKANAFTFGIQVVGTTDGRNEYNCTGIDSACINGGSGNKLVRNGVQITAAFTLTGTNTTSGVMS